MKHKDFIDLRKFTSQELFGLLSEAVRIKKDPHSYSSALKGKTLAMIFEKPSLRTRVTFDVGIYELGGQAIYLSPQEISLGKRESVADIARNLERMVHGIMARTFSYEVVVELANHAKIPVINGLTDFNHPCQAMADYMTILEIKKDLKGLKVAWVGDGNNVLHSLIHAGVRLGVNLVAAAPKGYEPKPEVVGWARENQSKNGARFELMQDAFKAVDRADVVYTDTWISMGQEAEAHARRKVFWPYQVNQELFSRAKPDAIFMHCLPAHRGEEVTDEIIDSPQSMVFQQAENRLHSQKAIMLYLMG